MEEFRLSSMLPGRDDSFEASRGLAPDGANPEKSTLFYNDPLEGMISSAFPPQASVSLPKSGGAISPIGEKLSFNASQGTASFSVPFPVSSTGARGGIQPSVSLNYSSGLGNGILGFGWDFGFATITRKTSDGIPRYGNVDMEDVFIFSGSEDLVPELEYNAAANEWGLPKPKRRVLGDVSYDVRRYRTRIEAIHQTIELWASSDIVTSHWRVITATNQTLMFGDSSNSRVSDPEHPERTFSWLLSSATDDKGNRMIFTYKAEDSSGIDTTKICERNRTELSRTANRYPSSIRYGGKTSTLSHRYQGDAGQHWFFEIAFDYGEFNNNNPTPADAGTNTWTSRKDAFSAYRSGFEVRTYRICRRILMFHHFPDEEGVGNDCLVKSMEFDYRESVRGSFLEMVTLKHHMRSKSGASNEPYITDGMPPVQFQYTQAAREDLKLKAVDFSSMENIPIPDSGTAMTFVDLYGDGIPGVLVQTPENNASSCSWYYKPALGNGSYGPAEEVKFRSSDAQLGNLGCHLADIDGDGLMELVHLAGPLPGFSHLHIPAPPLTPPRTPTELDDAWDSTTAFRSVVHADWHLADTQLVDLTGDGFPDILRTDDGHLRWFPGLGPEGFGPEAGSLVFPLSGEDEGYNQSQPARLIFGSPDFSTLFYLADMTGSGMSDIVRVHRDGEISYWPALGYGCFGSKITMENPPVLASNEDWDSRRIIFVDADGTGTADLVYLGHRAQLFYNQSGNSWSQGIDIPSPIGYDLGGWVLPQITDVLGLGTSAVVWSSDLGGDNVKMWYTDLSGGVKPNLLQSVINNQGAETYLHYASSTKFSIMDRLEGNRWRTRLPFPMQVVERIETVDRVGGTYHSMRYKFHHGYYDGSPHEREFRGFGMVERWDAETFDVFRENSGQRNLGKLLGDEESHVPPVWVKTWFHVGRGSRDLEHEYYTGKSLLPDFKPPAVVRREIGGDVGHAISATELRHLDRSFKAQTLRVEVYAMDGTAQQSRPYAITEHSVEADLCQPSLGRQAGSPSVFRPRVKQTARINLERAVSFDDAKIVQNVSLETDAFGNITKNVSIAYGRRSAPASDDKLLPSDVQSQKLTHVVYNDSTFTDIIRNEDVLRMPMLCEARTFQLFNSGSPSGETLFFTVEQITEMIKDSFIRDPLPFEDFQGAMQTRDAVYRRLISHGRVEFYNDNLTGPLPLRTASAHGVPYRNYRKAFPGSIINKTYVTPGRLAPSEVSDRLRRCGYMEENGDWWIPSAITFYTPEGVGDVSFVRENFFLPQRHRDTFHSSTMSTEHRAVYDNYQLMLLETVDPLGNRITVGERDFRAPGEHISKHGFDYRVLAPTTLMDANGNVSLAMYDVMGMCVGTVTKGKPGEGMGDSEERFESLLSPESVREFFDSPAKPGLVESLLRKATSRTLYDQNAYYRWSRTNPTSDSVPDPSTVAVIARGKHVSDLAAGEETTIQIALTYLDGLGRQIQSKRLVGPGPLYPGDNIITSPRWITSGWTVYNNKGLPVRKYEPYYSNKSFYEFGVRVGISSIPFYDPLGRTVAMLHPDHTWEKTTWDCWRSETWPAGATVDVNDPRTDPHVGGHFKRLPGPTENPDAPSPLFHPPWKAPRIDSSMGVEERRAAEKSLIHANTTVVSHLDATAAAIMSTARIITDREDGSPITDETIYRRSVYDVSGNVRIVNDASGRAVSKMEVDMLGRVLLQDNVDLGRSWSLPDVYGKPTCTWNERGDRLTMEFDALRRSISLDSTLYGETTSKVVQKIIYGESLTEPEKLNARGRMVGSYDQAGLLEILAFDFKGNSTESVRSLAVEYKETLNWINENTAPMLSTVHRSSMSFDALNRRIATTLPDGTIVRTTYDKEGHINKLSARKPGSPQDALYVIDIQYNAKGQRQSISFGNGTRTLYTYDPLTYLVRSIITRRDSTKFPGDCPQPPIPAWPGCQVQNLHYYYDAAGRISGIRDDAQQRIFFDGQKVEPSQDFVYDSLGQLVKATGREHLTAIYDAFDSAQTGLVHPNDGMKMRNYVQRFWHDVTGNILKLKHDAGDAGSWTKTFQYANANNRLLRVAKGGSGVAEEFSYDVMGNVTKAPQLSVLDWDYRNRLKKTARQNTGSSGGTPETTWHCYDAEGMRVRKVTENYAKPGESPTVKDQRIYLGSFEIYERFTAGSTKLDDATLRALHRDTMRLEGLVIVEQELGAATAFTRYQFTNHIGTSSIELDEDAVVVSFEEYTPFGPTSYQGVRNATTDAAKRYRYGGRERDEESGFYYNGLRYYMPWVCRWASPDPGGLVDGLNLYVYAQNNPVSRSDPGGMDSKGGAEAVEWKQVPVSAPWKPPNEKGEGGTPPEQIAREAYAGGQVVGGNMTWKPDGTKDADGNPVLRPVFDWIRPRDIGSGDPKEFPGLGVLTPTPGQTVQESVPTPESSGEGLMSVEPNPVTSSTETNQSSAATSAPAANGSGANESSPTSASGASESPVNAPVDPTVSGDSSGSASSGSSSTGSSSSDIDRGSLLFDRGLDMVFWYGLLAVGSAATILAAAEITFAVAAAALGLAAGIVGVVIGLIIFASSFYRTAAQNQEASNAAGTALGFAQHPLSIAGGVTGMVIGQSTGAGAEKGLSVGSTVGRVFAGKVDLDDAKAVGQSVAQVGVKAWPGVAGVISNAKSYTWDLFMALRGPQIWEWVKEKWNGK